MRIAITSQNFRSVTNHAGRARRFLVFEVSADQLPIEVERFDLPKEMCIHNLQGKLVDHPLDTVDVILSASFGAGFARNMARRNVIASLTDETEPLDAITDYLINGQRLPGVTLPNESHLHH